MSKQRIRRLIVTTLQYVGTFVGNLTGDVTGNLTGNVTGNLTGNVVGNVTGGARNAAVVVSASGAITVPTVNTTYHITKSSAAAAMTLVDPTAVTHDGVRATFLSETAQAHTLDNSAGSGFNAIGASKDIGTFGGAIGDGITIEARNGKWWVVPGSNLNVTLA